MLQNFAYYNNAPCVSQYMFCPICIAISAHTRIVIYGTPIRVWDNILSHMSMSYSQLASCVFYFACYISLHAGLQLATVRAAAVVVVVVAAAAAAAVSAAHAVVYAWDCSIALHTHMGQSHTHMGLSHTHAYTVAACGMHMHMEQSHTRMGLYPIVATRILRCSCCMLLPSNYMHVIYTRMGHSHMRMHGTIEQSHVYISMDCPIC